MNSGRGGHFHSRRNGKRTIGERRVQYHQSEQQNSTIHQNYDDDDDGMPEENVYGSPLLDSHVLQDDTQKRKDDQDNQIPSIDDHDNNNHTCTSYHQTITNVNRNYENEFPTKQGEGHDQKAGGMGANGQQVFAIEDLEMFCLLFHSMSDSRIVSLVYNSKVKWGMCWRQCDQLSRKALHSLIVTLARIPASSPNEQYEFEPNAIEEYTRAFRILCHSAVEPNENQEHDDDFSIIHCAEAIVNGISRCFKFLWPIEREIVENEIASVLCDVSGMLNLRHADHRQWSARIANQLEELEKSWTIKCFVPLIDEPQAEEDPGLVKAHSLKLSSHEKHAHFSNITHAWKHATIAWLANAKTFVPVCLPKMKTPGDAISDGVYNSPQDYFDTLLRLYIGLTFGEGHNLLSPFCKAWKNKEKPCGHTLWPIAAPHRSCPGQFPCRTRNCRRMAAYSCADKSHASQSSLCQRCYLLNQEKLRSSASGATASTHIYDGMVWKVNQDGYMFIDKVKSRKPPEKQIHWRTTRRLSCPNLVGIVQLKRRGSGLALDDRVYWAELVEHSKTHGFHHETNMREQGKVALRLLDNLHLEEKYAKGLLDGAPGEKQEKEQIFQPRDCVAILDLQTFSPEYLPVLKALEAQSKMPLPFQNGALLNIQPLDSDQDQYSNSKEQIVDAANGNGENFHYVTNKDKDEYILSEILPNPTNLKQLIQKMIWSSDLEPIIQIRKAPQAVEQLHRELFYLIQNATLDLGQLESCLEALTYPVHCTQGPPGTGKSYLGVIITRALLVIRRIWIATCPSIGAPPILVLSYKNHAIDEFLTDLVSSEQRSTLKLVRMGSAAKGNTALNQYSEHNIKSVQCNVEHYRMKMDIIQSCCARVPLLREELNAMSLAEGELQDDKFKKYKRKINYQAASICKASLKRVSQVMKKIGTEFVFQEHFSIITSNVTLPVTSSNIEVHFLSKLLEEAKQTSTCASSIVQKILPALYQGIQHYDNDMEMDEILLRWMQGFRPLPQCQYRDKNQIQCLFACEDHTEENICHRHQCQFWINEDKKCSAAQIQAENILFCINHKCQQSPECNMPKLSHPKQNYCEEHSCFICLEKNGVSFPAALALDESPRNTCENHPLCCAWQGSKPCQNEAIMFNGDKTYCLAHVQSRCKGSKKNGEQCKSTCIVSREHPFCIQHSQVPRNADTITEDLLTSDKKFQPKAQTWLKITRTFCKMKDCQSVALTNTFFCRDHIEVYQDVVMEPEEVKQGQFTFETVGENAEEELNLMEDEVEELEENDGCDYLVSSDEASSLECDTEELEDIEEDWIDGDEPDHILHLREIYEKSHVDSDEDEDGDGTGHCNDGGFDAFTKKDQAVNQLTWISPQFWNWEMSLDERWAACHSLMDMDSFLLTYIEGILQWQLKAAREELQREKLRAKCAVYEGKEVIGGTIVGCISRLQTIRATKPFAILIEEASEVMEPLIFACLGSTTTKLEMIGDHLQLRPSIMDKYDFERVNKINISMFERLINAPGYRPVPSNVLRVQRRMRPHICDLTRDYYSHITEIIDHPITRSKTIRPPPHRNHHHQHHGNHHQQNHGKHYQQHNNHSNNHHNLLKSCSGYGRVVPGVAPHLYFWTHLGTKQRAQVGLSMVNPKEAMMVCQLARYMHSCGVPKRSMAIITPYKGQLMLLRSHLQKEGLVPHRNGQSGQPAPSTYDSCVLSTVDRFQGDEADIVIVSLVIDERSHTSFVKLQNRMIVLLSRARIAMYLVGNAAYFDQHPVTHWTRTINALKLPYFVSDSAAYDAPAFEVFKNSRMGSSFPICCPVHRQQEMLYVEDPKNLKLGFCKQPCSFMLPCSHPCRQMCHFPDNNAHSKKCMENIASPCDRHTQQMLPCHELTQASGHAHIQAALNHYRCMEMVECQLPCTHPMSIPCIEELEISTSVRVWPECTAPAFASYIYEDCKHERADLACSELTMYQRYPDRVPPCTQETLFYPTSCSHSLQVKCYLKRAYLSRELAFVCPQKIAVILPRCRHPTEVSCGEAQKLKHWSGKSAVDFVLKEGLKYGPKDFNCREQIKIVRKCGHVIEMPCNAAFEALEQDGGLPPCQVEETFSGSPLCGHPLTVPCYLKQKLSYLPKFSSKRVATPCSNFSEKEDYQLLLLKENDISLFYQDMPPGLSIICESNMVLERLCGHQVMLSCHEIRQQFLPSSSSTPISPPICQERIVILDPLCHHRKISIPCGLQSVWNPWSKKTKKSPSNADDDVHAKFLQHNILVDDPDSSIISSIVPPPSLNEYYFNPSIGPCTTEVQVLKRSSCGHLITLSCHSAFQAVFNPDCSSSMFALKCTEEVKHEGQCGHIRAFECWEMDEFQAHPDHFPCHEKIDKKCWNFSKCQGTSIVECWASTPQEDSPSCSSATHACQKRMQYVCPSGHVVSDLLPIEMETPNNCPTCILEEIQRDLHISETCFPSAHPNYPPKLYQIPSNLHHHVMQQIENTPKNIASYASSFSSSLASYLLWCMNRPCWDCPLYQANEIPFFIEIPSKKIKTKKRKDNLYEHMEFSPPSMIKAADCNGVRVKVFNKHNVQQVARSWRSPSAEKEKQGNREFWYGMGMTFRTLVLPTDIERKEKDAINQKRSLSGYDTIYCSSSQSLIFFDPFCLYGICRFSLSQEECTQMACKMDDEEKENNINKLHPRSISFSKTKASTIPKTPLSLVPSSVSFFKSSTPTIKSSTPAMKCPAAVIESSAPVTKTSTSAIKSSTPVMSLPLRSSIKSLTTTDTLPKPKLLPLSTNILPKQPLASKSLSIPNKQVFSLFQRNPLVAGKIQTIAIHWNQETLVLKQLSQSSPEKEQTASVLKEMTGKLNVLRPSSSTSSSSHPPFAGIRYIEKLIKRQPHLFWELRLIQALEFMHLAYLPDATKRLVEYIDAFSQNAVQAAHPLLLVALGKLFSLQHQKNSSQEVDYTSQDYFDIFSRYFPQAAVKWSSMIPNIKRSDPSTSRHGALIPEKKTGTSTEEDFITEWEELKSHTNCQSAGMETLLQLKGLVAVKRKLIQVFGTALAYQKMPREIRERNLCSLNFAFAGNPGTGKTTVARLMAQILQDSGLLKRTQEWGSTASSSLMKRDNINILECSAQKLKDAGPEVFRDLIARAKGGVLFIDEAHDLDPVEDYRGKLIVSELITAAENGRHSVSIILAGYEDEMDERLFRSNDGLRSRFEFLYFEDFDERELSSIWQNLVIDNQWQSSVQVASVVSKRLGLQSRRKGFGNARSVRQLFERAVQSALSLSILKQNSNSPDPFTIRMEHVLGPHPLHNAKLTHILDEISSKIGWHNIKRSMKDLVNMATVNYEREMHGQEPIPFFLHRVLLGNPGTGKTTCAQLYGQLLKELCFLSKGDVMLKTASDFGGSYVGQSQSKTNMILDAAKGKVLVIDEAYNLDDDYYGKQVLDVLVERIQGTCYEDIAVLLVGYEAPMRKMLRNQNPGLARRFPLEYALVFDDYSDAELLELFTTYCDEKDLELASYEVSEYALQILTKQRKSARHFGNAGAVKLLVQHGMQNAIQRVSSISSSSTYGQYGYAKQPRLVLEVQDLNQDLDGRKQRYGSQKSNTMTDGNQIDQNSNQLSLVDDVFSALDHLYHMDHIRHGLLELYQVMRVAMEEGDVEPDVGHFIFSGAPGTGKTTVARIMGNLLYQLELISTNTCIETSGVEMMGEFVGQTKIKVKAMLDRAKGGILFIDEAYELGKKSNGTSNCFGDEALMVLVEAMTSLEYKGALVVIIAGYPHELNRMLAHNAGLKSRFTQTFEFQDWLPHHCLAFLQDKIQREHFILQESHHHPDLACHLEASLDTLINMNGWANGRDMNQMWKDILKYRALRVCGNPEIQKTIHVTEISQAIEKLKSSRNQSTSISEEERGDTVWLPFSPERSHRSSLLSRAQDNVTFAEPRDVPSSQPIMKMQGKPDMKHKVAPPSVRDPGVTDAIWTELEQAKVAYFEEREAKKEQDMQCKIQAELREMCPCPAGFEWFQVSNGWRCGGGTHFVSDAELASKSMTLEKGIEAYSVYHR